MYLFEESKDRFTVPTPSFQEITSEVVFLRIVVYSLLLS